MTDRSQQKAAFLEQIYQNLEASASSAASIRQTRPASFAPASGGGSLGEIRLQHQFKIRMAATATLPALISVLNGLLANPGASEELLASLETRREQLAAFLPFGPTFHSKFSLLLDKQKSARNKATIFSELSELVQEIQASQTLVETGSEAFTLLDLPAVEAPKTLLKFPPGPLRQNLVETDFKSLVQSEALNGILLYHSALINSQSWSKQRPAHRAEFEQTGYLFRLKAFSLIASGFRPLAGLPAETLILETAAWFDKLLQADSQQLAQFLQSQRAREGFSLLLQHQIETENSPSKTFERKLQIRLRYLGRAQVRVLIQSELGGTSPLPLALMRQLLGLPIKTPMQRKIQREFSLALDTPTGAIALTRLLKLLGQDFLEVPELKPDSGVRILA